MQDASFSAPYFVFYYECYTSCWERQISWLASCSTFGSLSYALVKKACQSQCSLKSHLTEDFGVMGSCSDYYLLQLWKILWFIFNVWHQNWLPTVVTPKFLCILAQLFWEALKYSFKSWAAECPGVLFSMSMESCGPLLAFLIFADGEWIIFVTIHLSKVAKSWCNFQSPIPQSNILLIYHKKWNHTAASYQTPSFKSQSHTVLFCAFRKVSL